MFTITEEANEIFLDQEIEPVYLTNSTCDSLLDPAVVKMVFDTIGLSYHSEGTGEVFPLTEEEQAFIGEFDVAGPYGGALFGPSYLFRRQKYIGPNVEVCYDGPERPFSIASYGGEILESSAIAWDAAERLSTFLNARIEPFGGMCRAQRGAPDRHFVLIMFPPSYLIGTFGSGPMAFTQFCQFIKNLFEGYDRK